MTDAQVIDYGHALAWYMGGSRETTNVFVPVVDAENGSLAVYWISGDAIGSLAIKAPVDGASSAWRVSTE